MTSDRMCSAVSVNGCQVYALPEGVSAEAPAGWRVDRVSDPVYGAAYRIAVPVSVDPSRVCYHWPWTWVRRTHAEAMRDTVRHAFPIGALVPFPLGGWVWIQTGGGYPDGCEAEALRLMDELDVAWSGANASALQYRAQMRHLMDGAVAKALREIELAQQEGPLTEAMGEAILNVLAGDVAAGAADMARVSLMDTARAAELLGISTRRVRALARSRNLGWQTARDWVFTPADIEAMRVRVPGRPR